MKYNPYSYSKIEKFRKCPKAFKFSYLMEPEQVFTRPEFQIGKALHYVSELIQKGEKFNLEEIVSRYVRKDVRDEIMDKGWEVSEWLKKPNPDNYRLLRFEQPIAIDAAFKNFDKPYWDKDVYFRGVIDRVELRKDSDKPRDKLKIIDLKFWKKVDLEIDTQLYLYAYVAWNLSKTRFGGLSTEIDMELWNMNYRGKKTAITADIEEVTKIAVDYLTTNIEKIESEEKFECNMSDDCITCEHVTYCDDVIKAEGEEKLIGDYILTKSTASDVENALKSYIKENGNISMAPGKIFGHFFKDRISFDGPEVGKIVQSFAGDDYFLENFHLSMTDMKKFAKKYDLDLEKLQEDHGTVKEVKSFGFLPE